MHSDIVAVHISQFLDELGPVLTAHFNHSGVETIMLHLEVAAVSSRLESLTKVITGSLGVTIGANYGHDEISFLLHVLNRNDQGLALCLAVALLAAGHDEVGQFDQSKWVLEQLSVLQVAILEDTIAELLCNLNLFLVEKAVAHAYDRLLHLLGKLDSFHQKWDVVLLAIKSIVCNPEVIVETSLDLVELLRGSLFRSLITHRIRVHILCVSRMTFAQVC